MAVDTYEGFLLLYDIPYTFVVLLYLLIKYVAIAAAVISMVAKKKKKCCNCWTEFMIWQVKLVFGGTGVSDHNLDAEEGQVYIRGNKVKGRNLSLLGAIILCFSLLLLLTMYSTYLLEVTHQCSDDPAIYCFARLPEGDDDSSSSSLLLNLTIDQDQRITNCSDYEDITATTPVIIHCFHYALNAKEALAAGGGLLAIFTVSMRFLISTIANIWVYLGKRCPNLRKAIQIAALLVLNIFNAVATIILITFTYIETLQLQEVNSDDDEVPVVQQAAAYLSDNGVQFIIMLSTVELLLLLDWSKFEKYQSKTKQGDNASDINLPSRKK